MPFLAILVVILSIMVLRHKLAKGISWLKVILALANWRQAARLGAVELGRAFRLLPSLHTSPSLSLAFGLAFFSTRWLWATIFPFRLIHCVTVYIKQEAPAFAADAPFLASLVLIEITMILLSTKLIFYI